MLNQLKILPIFIFVAMLAFSVRLMDVVSGVSQLSGSVQAQQQPDNEQLAQAGEPKSEFAQELEAALEESENDSSLGLFLDDEEEESEVTAEELTEPAEPPLDWLSDSSGDAQYSNVKQEVFEDMAERRKSLDARERQLQTREALLRAAEQELDRKFQELKSLRTEIEGLLQQQEGEEVKRIESLVKVYEGMKATQAANIFNTLDLDVLLEVVSRMSERKLSPILAAMSPERARTVTILLAEQKKLPELPSSN